MMAKEMRSRLISWVVTIFVIGFLFRAFRRTTGHTSVVWQRAIVLGRIFEDRPPMAGKERTQAYALGWIAGDCSLGQLHSDDVAL